jgi:hypothetical protein
LIDSSEFEKTSASPKEQLKAMIETHLPRHSAEDKQ